MDMITAMATLNAALLLLSAMLLMRGANVSDRNRETEVAVLQSEYQRLADLGRSHASLGEHLSNALARLELLENAERQKRNHSGELSTARQLLVEGADNDTVASQTSLCRTEIELLARLRNTQGDSTTASHTS